MAEKQATEAVETQDQKTAEAPAPVDLNVSDLIAIKNIIEVASDRGAFKAAELEAVGKTFNKLNMFLEAVTAEKKES
jgi:hypothetical protein